jgi:hypothetical protein
VNKRKDKIMFVETKREGEISVPLNKAQKLLLAAADIIERKGHVIGCLGDDKIGYCMVGALNMVESGHVGGGLSRSGESFARLANVIGTQNFGIWNDAHSTAEVLAALRTAAQ